MLAVAALLLRGGLGVLLGRGPPLDLKPAVLWLRADSSRGKILLFLREVLEDAAAGQAGG